MEHRLRTGRLAERLAAAFLCHLILLYLGSLFAVSPYSFFGICLLVLRFAFPLALLILPTPRAASPVWLPANPGAFWDLLPGFAILLLVGQVLPGSASRPDGSLLWLTLYLVVFVPVLEELFFRGFAMSALSGIDTRFALLLLSLLFALLHSGYGVVYALVAGFVLGGGMLLGHGLVWCILLHVLNNGCTLLFLQLHSAVPDLVKPLSYTLLALVSCAGILVAIWRGRRGCYRYTLPVYPTEDGAPCPLSVLVSPISLSALAGFVLLAILL